MVIKGVIRPPPEIRAVADRTALYVAKNGRAFEARILKSEKGKTPKFAFLQPTSPFHAYYEDRIQFYENGGDGDGESDKNKKNGENGNKEKKDVKQPTTSTSKDKQDGSESTKTQQNQQQQSKHRKREKTQKASAIDPIAKTILAQRAKITQARQIAEEEEEKRKKKIADGTSNMVDNYQKPSALVLASIPPPPPLELVAIAAPSNLPTVQIETIQLVAQFTALDGKGGPFLSHLSMREWNNSTFAFCQPRHAHFAYFSALVDAYRRILSVWTTAAKASASSSLSKKQKASATPTKTSEDSTAVDSGKGLQDALEQAAYRAEYERDIQQQRSQQEEGEILAIDWHDFVVVETIDFPVDEVVELSMLPPPPKPSSSTTSKPSPSGIANGNDDANGATGTSVHPKNEEMDESDDDEDDENEETIRVVPSYTPKVVATTNPQNSRAIDPITGKSVSVADMPEHMRIQLLDPKWAEERKKFQEKQKDSNLVSGDAIASNISRFAQAREDLFGKPEQEVLAKEKDSKKRLEEANRIIREQAHLPQQPMPSASSGTVGPTFPPPPPPPPGRKMGAPSQIEEPSSKRLRVDTSAHLPPPPPPPPSMMASSNNAAMAGATGDLGAQISPQLGESPKAMNLSTPTKATTGTTNTGMATTAPTATNATERQQEDTTEKKLLSESDFAASLGKPEVTLQIRIPNDPSQSWNFYGQILSMSVNVMTKVKAVKQELAKMHLNDMPANKIQFKDPKSGFLKDSMTLASLNIGPTATLELIPKTRGGRK